MLESPTEKCASAGRKPMNDIMTAAFIIIIIAILVCAQFASLAWGELRHIRRILEQKQGTDA